MRPISNRRAATGAAALAVVAAAGGFALDPKGFAGNILGEVIGVITSVLLAVFVLDRLVERDRRRRWSLVAEETLQTLRFALVRAGLAMYLRLPLPRPPTADPFTMQFGSTEALTLSFQSLGDHLRKLSDAEMGQPDLWLPVVEEQIRLIREGVMPRLIAIGDDNIVAAVSTVEGRYQDLNHAASLRERIGGEHVSDAAAELCYALSRVVERIPQ